MHVATPPAPRPPSTAHLALPFFDDAHRALAEGLVPWAAAQQVDETDDRAACRDWVQRLGAGGWLRYCVPAAHGGALPALDSRALVLLRETLAYHSPLADFAFAMQGLGSGAITLAGSPAAAPGYADGPATAARFTVQRNGPQSLTRSFASVRSKSFHSPSRRYWFLFFGLMVRR